MRTLKRQRCLGNYHCYYDYDYNYYCHVCLGTSDFLTQLQSEQRLLLEGHRHRLVRHHRGHRHRPLAEGQAEDLTGHQEEQAEADHQEQRRQEAWGRRHRERRLQAVNPETTGS